eukprot:6490454-Amphidinium_carterae.3
MPIRSLSCFMCVRVCVCVCVWDVADNITSTANPTVLHTESAKQDGLKGNAGFLVVLRPWTSVLFQRSELFSGIPATNPWRFSGAYNPWLNLTLQQRRYLQEVLQTCRLLCHCKTT